jgi:hypothetical protein
MPPFPRRATAPHKRQLRRGKQETAAGGTVAPELPAQFALGLVQSALARCRQVLPGAVDVEVSIDIAD